MSLNEIRIDENVSLRTRGSQKYQRYHNILALDLMVLKSNNVSIVDFFYSFNPLGSEGSVSLKLVYMPYHKMKRVLKGLY